MCASGIEERRSRHDAQAWVEEAIELETAEERRELGRRPSLVASRAEEKCVQVDLRKGVTEGSTKEEGTVGGIVGTVS